VTPQLILNIITSAVDDIQPRLVIPDPLRPAHGFTTCSMTGDVGFVCVMLSVALAFVCLFAACVLAWRLRNVSGLFSDAKPIALSMYLFMILSIVLLAVHIALPFRTRQEQMVRFAVRSGAILLAYQTTFSLLFLRRILHKNQSVTGGVTATTHGTTTVTTGAHNPKAKRNRTDRQRRAARDRMRVYKEAEAVSYRAPYRSAGTEDGQTIGMAPFMQQQQHSRAAVERVSSDTNGKATASAAAAAAAAASMRGWTLTTTNTMGTTGTGTTVGPSPFPSTLPPGLFSPQGRWPDHTMPTLMHLPPQQQFEDANGTEWSTSAASSLLALSTPHFHLPPRSEYEHFAAPQLLALLDDAAENIAGLQTLLENERDKQATRATMRRRHKLGQRGGANGSTAISPAITLLHPPSGVGARAAALEASAAAADDPRDVSGAPLLLPRPPDAAGVASDAGAVAGAPAPSAVLFRLRPSPDSAEEQNPLSRFEEEEEDDEDDEEEQMTADEDDDDEEEDDDNEENEDDENEYDENEEQDKVKGNGLRRERMEEEEEEGPIGPSASPEGNIPTTAAVAPPPHGNRAHPRKAQE
jgi:hypothetical protein